MGSTVLRVKLATAPLHLSLTFSYTNILGILFYSLVRVIICLCFLLSSRLFYFVHTLFCIYCLWWLQWSLMLPGAIGTEPYNKPHTPHSHRNRYRWATRTPSLRCDMNRPEYLHITVFWLWMSSVSRPQRNRSDSPRWFTTKMMQILRAKSSRWAASKGTLWLTFVNGSCLYSSLYYNTHIFYTVEIWGPMVKNLIALLGPYDFMMIWKTLHMNFISRATLRVHFEHFTFRCELWSDTHRNSVFTTTHQNLTWNEKYSTIVQ